MYSKKVKQMVAGQLINMLDNNVLNANGYEPFTGWLEDGGVFFAADEYSDKEIEQAMKLVHEIADAVDDISWMLDVQPYEINAYTDVNDVAIGVDAKVIWHDDAGKDENGVHFKFIVVEADGDGNFNLSYGNDDPYPSRWAYCKELEIID